jgi:hypothetical protein
MYRNYRRPGLARRVPDIFESRDPQQQPVRNSPPKHARLNNLQSLPAEEKSPPEISLPKPDRRFALRLTAIERPFEVQCEGSEQHRVFMEDISRTGMRFRTEVAYPCGKVLFVEAPDSLQLAPIQVRIVRSQMIDPGMPERGFEYGVEYVMLDDLPHAWFHATRLKR